MAGCKRQDAFRQAVRQCQWQSVRQLVLRGCSLEQRDVAVSQAVRHSQWWLVSQLVQLGVSQQHRDQAVHKAVRYCLWDMVDELVEAGVSGDERDFLLQRGLRQRQWDLVSRLLTLGAGLELRDLVVREALEHGQWLVVLAALRLGVRQELVATVFQGVISQNSWQHAPSLVQLVRSTEHTDFVLQAAIRACQWDCVRQLIKTGLTPQQQHLVCSEALEWAHFECALELLRQGCEQGCADRIVLEVLRWKRCQDLVHILQEDGVGSRLRDVVLCTAKRYELWDDYLTILKHIGPTDQEMADVITTALYSTNVCVLLRLLSLFSATRRVFKQVLMRTRFFDHDIIVLHTFLLDDHPDLAFYMFTAQQMWDNVVGMFGDVRLSASDRRFALRHAVKKCAWHFVEALADHCLVSDSDRRYAFLQAARQGQWSLALRLSANVSTITDSDKLFALRTWLKVGLWGCLSDVLSEWDQPSGGLLGLRKMLPKNRKPFVRCVLEELIIGDNLTGFLHVCREILLESNDFLFIVKTAIKYDKCEFILQFCRSEGNEEHFSVAVKQAAQHKRWHLLKDLVTGRNEYADKWYSSETFDLKLLRLCSLHIVSEEGAWPIVVPALNELCGSLTDYDGMNWAFRENLIEPELGEGVQRLSDWCLVRSFWNAGLVFSALSHHETCFTRITDQETSEVDTNVFAFCFVIVVKNSDWSMAADCLRKLPDDDAENLVDDLQSDIQFTTLIQACRKRGRHKMAVLIGLWIEDWEQVGNDLPHCTDTNVIDSVIRQATYSQKWNLVHAHLDRCSQDSGLLYVILQSAVEGGESEIATRLMSELDLTLTPLSADRLLYKAVTSSGDREQMVKLCIQFGLSTHMRACGCGVSNACYHCFMSPMRNALRNGQMPLIKLLYRAGACCNKRLFGCKQDDDLRSQLQGQGRQDIVDYLHQAATTPRTLQDLCRLQVSHLIGCQPGRQDRVAALDITWPAGDLINFQDVLS